MTLCFTSLMRATIRLNQMKMPFLSVKSGRIEASKMVQPKNKFL